MMPIDDKSIGNVAGSLGDPSVPEAREKLERFLREDGKTLTLTEQQRIRIEDALRSQ
ncbi:hypothetical protein [Kerstersia gyiorum]|uniref:hypothetical protein n=1 Tax=Kerstersia gyiorum TaxID=206506 RepID=UPI0020A01296|nr:hypothetical protein [Kerstersia gyiorum]MCP1679423.1 hypothetical protein [Kerstersia gyiorum]MCP1823926.1 hypothetical protein [Kerstersia gyiorum]MCP1827367.1 hypothetical protein [Kerstersia gyiorum]MCW2448984.1 hypothetical protein [Kerstersia gyiorum]